MTKFSVKKDDYVMIITGKDKGKTARITAVDRTNHRVLIEGDGLKTVNTKAVKARKASDQGGLIKQPGSVDISNVMPICSACNKPTRVGYRIGEDGKRERYCVKCGAALVTKKATAKKATKAKAATRRKKAAAEDAAVVAEAPATEVKAEASAEANSEE